MGKPIQISISTPCLEDWQQMTPVEKGRFCASCAKKVFDFRQSSDREIAAALKQDKHLCGRFLNTQLNRDLVVPQEKSTLWIAASAAIISFLSLGNNEARAQENQERQKITTVLPLSDKRRHKIEVVGRRTVVGAIGDAADSLVINGATIKNVNTLAIVQTDPSGRFTIEAMSGDTIEIYAEGYVFRKIVYDSSNFENIIYLKKAPHVSCTIGSVVQGIKIESRGNVPTNRGYWSIWDLFK